MVASNFQSSFIPKSTGGFTPDSGTPRRSPIGFFGVLSVTLFLIVLLVTIGLMGYKYILKNSITKMQPELLLAEQSIDIATIDSMFAFNKKLTAGREVVMRHRVVSNFLSLLAENTIQSIVFREFGYQFASENELTVTLSGTAPSYSSLALQEDILLKLKEIKSAEFSGLALTEGGRVSFQLSIVVDPISALYLSPIENAIDADENTADIEMSLEDDLEDINIPDLDDL